MTELGLARCMTLPQRSPSDSPSPGGAARVCGPPGDFVNPAWNGAPRGHATGTDMARHGGLHPSPADAISPLRRPSHRLLGTVAATLLAAAPAQAQVSWADWVSSSPTAPPNTIEGTLQFGGSTINVT